jgi:hypothetical protein
VSVDVVAELPAPVSLAAALEKAGDALRALLGPRSEPPELAVLEGWRAENHSREPSRRLLSAGDLTRTMIGQRIPPDDEEIAGSVEFEVDLTGGHDRAYVMVIDLTGVQDTESHVEAVASAVRTCAGVVLATAIALGAASASEQFMRQFPSLNGWPKDRSARDA